eukprot:GHVN01089051.1.p2 GENE.GHVN01089051.1~~GHVN01089051.1.p2  ORF type:complete len:122 (-),score=15.31 GHVN01089051.1:2573-2938(-)
MSQKVRMTSWDGDLGSDQTESCAQKTILGVIRLCNRKQQFADTQHHNTRGRPKWDRRPSKPRGESSRRASQFATTNVWSISYKLDVVSLVLASHNIYLIVVTDAWLLGLTELTAVKVKLVV